MADSNGIDLPSDLREAWDEVLTHWEDEAAHRRFVALCSATRRLAEAGRAYRWMRDNDPERREDAARRIDAIMTLALQELEPLRTPSRRRSSGLYFAALGVGSSLAFYALWALMRGG